MKWMLRNPALVILILASLTFVALISVAWGDDGHGHDHGGDSAVNVKDSSRAIGVGGADYDIGRGSCKFHVGGLTVAIARTDEFCEGMEMIRAGLVEAGILHLCKQSKVGENYSTLEDCQSGLEVTTNLILTETELVVEDKDDEDHHEVETYLAELESRMAAVESRRQTTRVTREIIQQPFLSDEKRAKLQAVLDE